MKVKELVNFLFEIAPENLKEDYDNVGLLVGDENAEISGVVVALDCFSEVVNRAEELEANVIVTHHPVIFDPLKSVTEQSLVYKLIKKGISVISMHTNLDKAEGGVNDALCSKLGLNGVKTVDTHEGFPIRVGQLPSAQDPYAFAETIKQALGGSVKFVAKEGKEIKTVAVCSGSGGDFIYDALHLGADALVTADIKHHLFIEAGENEISLYDAGHFNTEDVIIAPLSNRIKNAFHNLPVFECHLSKIESI